MNDLVGAEGQEAPRKPVSYQELPGHQSRRLSSDMEGGSPDWYHLAGQTLVHIANSMRQAGSLQLDDTIKVKMTEECGRIATGIVDSLEGSYQLLAKAISGTKGPLIVTNMVNVSILATEIGMGVGYPRADLVRLAHAGLLHDVGMLVLPDSLVNSPRELSTDERTALMRHPDYGHQVLRQLGPEYDWLALVAWQEHERWKGQGYPQGLQGEDIHEYARIIGIVDVLDALINPRPYRRRLLPHEAVRELLISEKEGFSSLIIKALVQQFSLFPLGTTVRVNTGEVGVVVQLNPRYPLRPIIEISPAADWADPTTPKVVDLSKTTLVHIVEVVEPDAADHPLMESV
jgi:HD-GYP domain-containing protein (c-di-GMP phosphodiesterase class II)